jgi:hypothetical protein
MMDEDISNGERPKVIEAIEPLHTGHGSAGQTNGAANDKRLIKRSPSSFRRSSASLQNIQQQIARVKFFL